MADDSDDELSGVTITGRSSQHADDDPLPGVTRTQVAPSSDALGSYLPSFYAGVAHGFGDVTSAPQVIAKNIGLGDVSWLPHPGWESGYLQPGDEAAYRAHPGWGKAGRFTGQALTTAPILAGTTAAAEALPIAGAVGGALDAVPYAGSAIRGGLLGAEQAGLTSGEDPGGDLSSRLGWGAVTGGLLGPVGEWIGNQFGGGVRLASRDVQQSARTAQAPDPRYGTAIDVRPENLPKAGEPGTSGALANPEQLSQINQKFSHILGRNFDRWDTTNLNDLDTNLQQELDRGRNQIAIRGAAGPTGQTYLARANQIMQDANRPPVISGLNPPEVQQLQDVTDGIRTALQQGGRGGGGRLTQGDYMALTGPNSRLGTLARSNNANLAGYANRIRDALDDAFRTNNPNQFEVFNDIRNDQRLSAAIRRNVGTGTNINPATIERDIQQEFGPRGIPPGRHSEAGDLARSVGTLFGGDTGQRPTSGLARIAQRALDVIPRGPAAIGSAILGAPYSEIGGRMLDFAGLSPYTVPVGAGLALGGGAIRAAGRAYQRSPEFANQLIDRGVQAGRRWLAPLTSVGATTGINIEPPPSP
jgi:hypothetical protein